MKKEKVSFSSLFKLVKPYKKSFILVGVLSLIFVLCTLALPLLFGEAIDCIYYKKVDTSFGGIITENDRIIDVLTVNFKKIGILSVIAGGLVFIAFISHRLMGIINNKTTYKIVRDLKKQAFEKVQRLPLKYIDNTSSGNIVANIVSDSERVGEGLLLTFEQLFTGVFTIVFIVIFMLTKEIIISRVPYVTMLLLLLTPLSVFIARLIAKKSSKYFSDRAKTNAKQLAYINETVTNEKLVQAFNRQDKVIKDFEIINEENRKANLKATFYSSTVNPTTRFMYNLIYALICLAGAFLILSGKGMGIGDLFVFLSYSNQYTKPFNEISSVLTELQYSAVCAERIVKLLNEPEEISIGIQEKEFNGNVEFKDVEFSYVEDKKLIQNLNIDVKSGQKIAIVGPTGCGKTTLINLLVRFYDIKSGQILFDGVNACDFTRGAIRNNIGMVLQDCYIFTGTVKENVALGKPDATEEEIILACKNSFADSFISKMENGYDTIISENSGLSQGQKQLLAIARIMLISPPIIILDEATSSIDFRTEEKIQQAIARLSQGKTVFTVAHRLATIKNADLILVLNNGKVIEQGTHEDLIKKNGFYTNLYNSQFE